ncbi:ScbA/BarX family gamma-butyrolactone biosynthesis protein [Streptomyces sp. NPDC001851]|uniref:ScbA/BarX family gamma-butyrolactone biosynthesis protein n=1 Tax=Streptomyces sp. NPDC001851 TaxID=3154529 RepID=UPI003331ADAD
MIRTAQDPAVSSWAPVPQRHVHKHNADETLLTSWRRTGPDGFLIKARWPAAHSFYATGADGVDPLLFSETVRQCLPMLSHEAYDVPLGHHLLWETYDYALTDVPAAGGNACDIVLHAHCTDVLRRGTRTAAATVHLRALRSGTLIGTATTRFAIQPGTVYRRLRGRYADLERALGSRLDPAAPLPARAAGRDRPDDVVLSPTGVPGRHRLRVDTGHPILFDHPVDHVPGMLLLDAARQAAHTASTARPARAVAMTTRFLRYVELDAPCWVDTATDPADPDRVLVTARQHERVCFTASVALAAVSAADTLHAARSAA